MENPKSELKDPKKKKSEDVYQIVSTRFCENRRSPKETPEIKTSGISLNIPSICYISASRYPAKLHV